MSMIRIALVALALLVGAAPVSAQAHVVIVNAANPVTSLKKDKANGIFLRRVSRWDDGRAVMPVNLPRTASARESFSKAVHGRGVSAIESHWQQQIFAGKEAPPAEREDDAAVIAYVRANPGAIGYVSANANLGGDVKVVTVN
jgi:ABC-type phosphate transport system substrate-binding protein